MAPSPQPLALSFPPLFLHPQVLFSPSSPSSFLFFPHTKKKEQENKRERSVIQEKQLSSSSSSSSSPMVEPNSVAHPSKPLPPKANQNHSKPFSSFLYKIILVSVLIALLPIFPSSQAPELPSKSILAQTWELLHLLLVGIAISYGLFSRRNSDPEIEKETQLKADATPQSYVSQILQVSSVFDDEEIDSPKGLDFVDEAKNQTWNYSQNYREEPVVMVAKETANATNSSTKPLFLPFRSLKSRPLYQDSFDFGSEINDDKTGKIGGREGVVLPSPIPWRSRSARMEVKEESSPPYSPINPSFDTELGPSKTPSFRSPTPGSASRTPSPKRLSPSRSLSPEIRGKINEDFARKKSLYKSSPPPAPPPPPPPLSHTSQFISEKRDARKSFKAELEDLSRRGRRVAFIQRNDVGSDSFNSEKDSYAGRSVRTVRSKEAQSLPPLPRKQRQKKDEFMEKMIIAASDSESSDGDDDDDGELPNADKTSDYVSTEAVPEENEVDKKADEFIAKFREQIRLQRIASIKKSSGQRSIRNSN